jgi:hypothetical protein
MKKKQQYLYLVYKESCTGGKPEDPQDRWTSYSDTYVDWTPLAILKKTPDTPYYEDVEVDFTPLKGEEVYAIIVKYRSGDTFGTSYGNGMCEQIVKTEQEAIKIAKEIEKGTYKSPYGFNEWEGYFEELEGVQIHCFKVSNTNREGRIIYH